MISGDYGNDLIFSDKPASEWALGYPLGNGRTGAMVKGKVKAERIALNHDLLWRRFMDRPEKKTAALLPEVRRLCAQGRWDEAQDLFLTRVPETGHALYINPFVPFCDLGLFLHHKGGEITNYRRQLDMKRAVVTVEYDAGQRHYRREYFCSFPAGLFFVRVTCSAMGCLGGEVSLSRLPDPDCEITGCSSPGLILLEGLFEEGVRFAARARVYQKGGRLTNGIRTYQPPPGKIPPPDTGGIVFDFRDETQKFEPCGVSTCFDAADEVLIAVALATDDEADCPPEALCDRKIEALGDVFPDTQALLEQHAADHGQFYGRAGLFIGGGSVGETADTLVERAAAGDVDNALYGLLYHMSRYLAIAAGRPQLRGGAPKSPINLQGLWNQDRRPAWDCDYHLDLNLQMSYWGLDAANLGDLMEPLTAWIRRLLPQARACAADIHGCGGILLPATCDNKTPGNIDNIGYCFTAAAAWLAQVLWIHYDYSRDETFLKNDLYGFLKEIAAFYDDFLILDDKGRLVTCPSCSPEMGIMGRTKWSVLSSASSMDLELIREVYEHLLEASARLGVDAGLQASWSQTLAKLPLPPISAEHGLEEWLEPHEPYDPGHRHRSHLVGIVPGGRITPEDTPEYAQAVRKALEYRLAEGAGSSASFSCVTDAMIFARLYDAPAALEQLRQTVERHVMENLLTAICDWRGRGESLAWFNGRKVFQIEAGLGLGCAIAEMLLQSRRGVIRLLPALPGEWKDGSFFGLCAAGGFEAAAKWAGGKLEQAKIISKFGGPCRVMPFRAEWPLTVWLEGAKIRADVSGGVLSFETKAGGRYTLRPAENGENR
ncbi:MAG TPA: glycoside hydrolase family 95 protein [Clostridiales bacterium]|nr:MAG: hypothetical protein BWY37_01113 [Firmicutes bacterium ADurb.Bin262]HOU09227.1 glycoside hydrolase family 95 protein [Clostridiales bacterium]